MPPILNLPADGSRRTGGVTLPPRRIAGTLDSHLAYRFAPFDRTQANFSRSLPGDTMANGQAGVAGQRWWHLA